MLEDIKGVGSKSVSYFNELGIFNINDLLEYYPYRYNVYKPSSIEDATEKAVILLNGIIEGPIQVVFLPRKLNKLSFRLNTGNYLINVCIFNRAYMKKNIVVGKKISVIGKYNKKSNLLVASELKLVPILKTEIEGVYHLNQKIKKQTFKKALKNAIDENIFVSSNVPDYIANKYNFMSKMEAIKEIHFPTSSDNLKQAKLFLTYEELFEFCLKMNYLKCLKKDVNNNEKKNIDRVEVDRFILNLPFKLTIDQIKAIDDIYLDFVSNNRMNRLLLGDVGSGKTIVSFLALFMNYLAGYQGVLMAPTEILAFQHFNSMIECFKTENLVVKILTSSTSKKERMEILELCKNGKCDVLIGTHSVLNEEVIFANLGLVITDEQHRFGVAQRKNLQKKGSMCDVLYLSATPIPRTLALTIYGDMDISQIKTKPANRKDVKTQIYKNSDIKQVLGEMLEEIKLVHQIYVVAPLIYDEDGNSSLENVLSLQNKMELAFNNKIPIGVLHGKLSSSDKAKIMADFKDNKIKILISTTVIEVGVDVKNATMMVVFNAERFGLATLHQLRGRIGRNDLDCKCVLISDFDVPRLKIMESTNDGFEISEKDFELRGSGDLFGIKQSGDMSFKLADLAHDFKILKQCDADVKEFLNDNLQEIDRFPKQKELLNSIFLNG